MFDKKQDNTEVNNLKEQLKQEKHDRALEIQKLEQDKVLALKEKEFELKHFKDEEMKNIQEELNGEKTKNAVLIKENEMLGKITNLNADIIDIKDLVANLINKLPEIKLNNLTIQSGDSNNK